MNIASIISIVPQILLLIIPGFLALRIEEHFYPKKKHNDFDTTLYSVFYSTIISVIFQLTKFIISTLFPNFWMKVPKNIVFKQIIYWSMAVILSFAWIKLQKKGFGKSFNKKMKPFQSVWEVFMSEADGKWAMVYLKNGLVYMGTIRQFTDDPSESIREIKIEDCDVYQINPKYSETSDSPQCKDVAFTSEFLKKVDRKSTIQSVLIDSSNIASIEILNDNNCQHKINTLLSAISKSGKDIDAIIHAIES